ncbi:MAG: hypothetical protein R2788_06075 [Saprospiraceae bacterium]
MSYPINGRNQLSNIWLKSTGSTESVSFAIRGRRPARPSTGSNLMNRRVEFRAASENDQDMPAPASHSSKKGKKRGY